MRIISFINLAGLLALGVLCVSQWQDNRQFNQEINRLEGIRIGHTEKLDERDKTILGQAADLKELRGQMVKLTSDLKTTKGELNLERQRNAQLSLERDRLQVSIKEWAEAVKARDERIDENQKQIQELARSVNDAVLKYNGLATNYNESVKLLNLRTAEYTELVTKFNKLAKGRQ
jgi:chromosome segregation ATPase